MGDIARAITVIGSIGPDGVLSVNLLVEAFEKVRTEALSSCANDLEKMVAEYRRHPHPITVPDSMQRLATKWRQAEKR